MARIRTIKPEFPQSETIGRLSRDARLLFVQLWTIVDDAGRSRAASRMLASLLYPYDDDAPALIEGWLSDLEREHCIRRYIVDGTTYLEIANWLQHQKIDRPSPSRFPEYREPSLNPREDSRASDADLVPSTLDQGSTSLRSVSEREKPIEKSKKGTRLSPAWSPSAENMLDAVALCLTDADIAKEAGRFRDWALAAPGSKGVKLDWDAAWRNWCRTAAEKLGRAPALPPGDAKAPLIHAPAQSPQLQAWDDYRQALEGKTYPRDSKGGWSFTTEWPPGYVQKAEAA